MPNIYLTRLNNSRGSIWLALIVVCVSLVLLTVNDAEQQRKLNRVSKQTEGAFIVAKLSEEFAHLREFFNEEADTGTTCDENMIYRLRARQFDLPFVSEFGVVTEDGMLTCTSWQKLTPPLEVPVKPAIESGLRYFGPTMVEFMQKSAFVVAQTRPDGSEINALLPVSWMQTMLQGSANNKQEFRALIDAQTGVPLILIGEYTLPILLSETLFPLTSDFRYEGKVDNLESYYLTINIIPDLPDLAVVIGTNINSLYQSDYRLNGINLLFSIALGVITFAVAFSFQSNVLSFTKRIELGIRRNEFVNYYQPIIDARTGRPIGLEVLLRWQHPVEGLLPPNVFIPQAERSGQIIPMTAKVVDNALAELTELIQEFGQLRTNINICGQHLKDQSFISTLLERSAAFPAITLELTENEIVEYQDEGVIESINRLRASDVKLAVDDFGTGYSGLRYLDELPIDSIKIDRSFVAACGTDSPGATVLEFMVKMAVDLKLSVVAEGVETERQAQYLADRGVFMHQGWLYAKAMPIDELRPYFAALENAPDQAAHSPDSATSLSS